MLKSKREERVQKLVESGKYVKDGKFPVQYLEEGAVAYYKGYGGGITFMAAFDVFGQVLTDSEVELHIGRENVESDKFYTVRPILGKIKVEADFIEGVDFDPQAGPEWLKYAPDPRKQDGEDIVFEDVDRVISVGDGEVRIYFYLGQPVLEALYYGKLDVPECEDITVYERFMHALDLFIKEETTKRAKATAEEVLLWHIFGDKSKFRYTDDAGLVYDTTRCELLGEGYFTEGYIFFYRKRTGKFFSIVQPRLAGEKVLHVHTDESAAKIAGQYLKLNYMKQEVYDKYFGPDANKRVTLNTTVSKSLRDRVSASRKSIAQILELGLKADAVAIGKDFVVEDRKSRMGDTPQDEIERLVENLVDEDFDGILDAEDLATVISLSVDWRIFQDLVPNGSEEEYKDWEEKFTAAREVYIS